MDDSIHLRNCLRDPIPEIEEAAALLGMAVTAYLEDRHSDAVELIVRSNMPAIREWTESLWGKNSKYAPVGPLSGPPIVGDRSGHRVPSLSLQRALHKRDGYYCRFCGIPVVRKQVRELLRHAYPDVPIWGRKNIDQHAALQCMWAQYDHLLPYSRGGSDALDNLVIACAPCNFCRMQHTLEESGLMNPLARAPRTGDWDGLERVLS